MTTATQPPKTQAPATQHHALGYFITRLVEECADGSRRISHSRRHRKRLPPIELARDGRSLMRRPDHKPWLRLWAPGRLAWWIAVMFIPGASCFAVGGYAATWPQYSPALLQQGFVLGLVFFVGSLFFTTAAWLQLEEAINGDVADLPRGGAGGWRWLAWKPRNAGYSAALIQFIGTLLFNVNTADAMFSQLTWQQEEVLIWAPNVLGSICFLVSSYLAVVEVSHRFWSWRPRDLSWWIVIINLVGSIAFMASAVFNFYLPSTGQEYWSWGASFTTMLGALCFFAASYLMIPEQAGAGAAIDLPDAVAGPTSRTA
jgi:hypothetical protein